jgi:hypothetical protein
MRTVWLALFCLIGLVTAVVVKIGISSYAGAEVSQASAPSAPADISQDAVSPATPAAPSDDGTIATSVQSDTLTKGDRVEQSSPAEAQSGKPVVITPAETEPKLSKKPERIMTWHWHDPLDNRGVPAVHPSSKRKLAKPSPSRVTTSPARTR